MKSKSVRAVLVALPLFAAVAAAAEEKAPLKINFGYTTADHVNLYVAQDLGLFQKAGLEPTFFTFQSGAPLLAALKSESVDVVLAGLGFAFALGQNIPLKMIYWNTNDALGEGWWSTRAAKSSRFGISPRQRRSELRRGPAPRSHST